MKWVKAFYNSFTGVPASFIDGVLAVGIAFLTAISLGLASEESYKYIDPYVRFWTVLIVGAFVQGLHALSKYRDNTFQRHLDKAEKDAKNLVASTPTDASIKT